MEHFDIILTLARMATEGDIQRSTYQLERLRDALRDASPEQASKLTRVLTRKERRQSVTPMSLEQMRNSATLPTRAITFLHGEQLTRSTPLPHDRETSAPLVRVNFPEDLATDVPVLTEPLTRAIDEILLEWEKIDELITIKVQPHMSCLLFGAPGVGKTQLARYIASRLNLPCVEARLDGLVSSFLGTTSRNIGGLFDFANRYRCVLFLDEFDAIAKARDDAQEVGEIKRVVNTLLQSLDERRARGITVAATNHEHLLDNAVWRRFECRISIPKPDELARKKILTKYLIPLKLTSEEMQLLTWITDGMSGADLESLVASGKRYFVLHNPPQKSNNGRRNGRKSHLIDALRRVAILNSGLFASDRRELLLASQELLARAMWERVGLVQKDIGTLLGLSQSAVSRLLQGGEGVSQETTIEESNQE